MLTALGKPMHVLEKNLGKGSLTHFEPFSQNSLYNDVKTKHPWGISLRNAHFLRIPPNLLS
jgi:hypothetical protein